METALEQSKRQWLSQAHQQWNEIAASTIASKQEESSRRWQEISVETMEQLRQIDLQMVHWQELWDASTPHQQHRVGSKLPSHPDTYLSASR
jgi:hypothetical protein